MDTSTDYTINKEYPLKNEQNECVEFLLKGIRCVLSAQAGYGKTYISITAAEYIHRKYEQARTIVLCPSSATGVFIKEITQKINSSYCICTADGVEGNLSSKFVIVTHSSFYKHVSLIGDLITRNKTVLILDEAHIMQSENSQFQQLLRPMSRYFAAIFAMTATPVLNKLLGFYSLMQFVYPDLLGQRYHFIDRYVIMDTKKIWKNGVQRKIPVYIGSKNLPHLKTIVDPYVLIKRLVYDVQFEYKTTRMNDHELLLYREAAKGVIDKDYEGEKAYGGRLHDLQRVVDGSLKDYWNPKINSKEKLLIESINEVCSRKQACLVYVEYNDTLFRLRKLAEKAQPYYGWGKIYEISGETSVEDRHLIEKIICPKDVVFVTQAGSQSYNLQRANNVIFYDIPFAIGRFIQFVGRVCRMDSIFAKQYVYILEVVDTIDTYKRLLIEKNGTTIRELFGEDESLQTDLPEIERKFEKELKQSLAKYLQKLKRELLWKRG